MKKLRIENRRISKLLILALSVIIILQACESTFSGTFTKIPKEKFETIAELPSFGSILANYVRWEFIQLKSGREGIAFIREVHGLLGGSCFLLGLYDIEKKEIIKDIFLATDEELDMEYPYSHMDIVPDILVDSENKLYISMKDKIIICDNKLNILNILEPNLKDYDLNYLTMSFVKKSKIFFLQEGRIFSIDANTGKIVDYINIDKGKYPELKNLGTWYIADYKDSLILIYYGDFPKGKEKRRVIFIYDIDNHSVTNKFVFSDKHYLISGEIGNPIGFKSCYPYIFIMLCNNNSDINIFTYNIETKNEEILQLEKKFFICETSAYTIMKKEGRYYYLYIWEHFYDNNGENKDAVYSANITEYLK